MNISRITESEIKNFAIELLKKQTLKHWKGLCGEI